MTASDPVLEILLRIAGDYTPGVDASQEAQARMIGAYPLSPIMAYAWRHPAVGRLAAALESDQDFSIFVGGDGAMLNYSSGSGTHIQPWNFASTMLSSAASFLIAHGVDPFDADALARQMERTLPEFRRLLRGEVGTAVYLIGLDGFELDARSRLDTPWGLLRPAGERERTYGVFYGNTTVVLAREAPVRLTVGGSTSLSTLDTTAAEMVDGTQRLALAVLLSAQRDSLLAPRPSWVTAVVPGSAVSGSSGWGMAAQTPDPGPPLAGDEIPVLEEMIAQVDRLWHPSIRLAVQRTVRAIRERRDAADALIDAVIAWESLVGGRGEQRFRVSAALAHLIEEDPSERGCLRQRLAKVYDARSKVVHGGLLDNVRAEADLAIDAAVSALRTLFVALPDLVAEQERADRLLLGDYARRA